MKKILLVLFSILLVLGFIICPGCTTTKASGTQPDLSLSQPAETQDLARTTAGDPEKTIRAFLGDPAVPVVFEKNFTNTRGIDLKTYRVNGDRFTIDAETGTILGVSVISPDSKKIGPLSKDQAEVVALEYATRHFPDFSTRNMQLAESRLIDHGAAGAEYSFLWSEQTFGINNGNYAGLNVDPNGKIMGYHSNDKPAPVIRPSRISKAAANATAVEYVISRTQIGNITTIESGSRLSVHNSDPATIAWTVDLEIRFLLPSGLEDHRGGKVYVDAMKGNVINYEPCM